MSGLVEVISEDSNAKWSRSFIKCQNKQKQKIYSPQAQ